jgi:hypothetical protein
MKIIRPRFITKKIILTKLLYGGALPAEAAALPAPEGVAGVGAELFPALSLFNDQVTHVIKH